MAAIAEAGPVSRRGFLKGLAVLWGGLGAAVTGVWGGMRDAALGRRPAEPARRLAPPPHSVKRLREDRRG